MKDKNVQYFIWLFWILGISTFSNIFQTNSFNLVFLVDYMLKDKKELEVSVAVAAHTHYHKWFKSLNKMHLVLKSGLRSRTIC